MAHKTFCGEKIKKKDEGLRDEKVPFFESFTEFL